MKNLCILLVAAFAAIQVCNSATVEDAENELQKLREMTNHKIEEAFHEHSKISNEVDEIALSTKQRSLEDITKKTDNYEAHLRADKTLSYKCRGTRDHLYEDLKKSNSDDLTRCVNLQSSESVSALSTRRLALVEYVWNAIFEEEKHIIACGKNSNCLEAAIADIKDKIYEVAQVINADVQSSKNNKEAQLQVIKGCGSRSVANAEHALSKVPTCTY